MKTESSITGEYYLRGAREMASGFLLEPDGNFKFFFSYGALDRHGSGTWRIKDNQLILNSRPKPTHDFAFVDSREGNGNDIIISIKDANPNMFRNFYASLENGVGGSWQPANNEGEIIFPAKKLESISLLFEFCPERFSVFKELKTKHHEFDFRIEPWIIEVFLTDFTLTTKDGMLVGPHPLMEGVKYEYVKQ